MEYVYIPAVVILFLTCVYFVLSYFAACYAVQPKRRTMSVRIKHEWQDKKSPKSLYALPFREVVTSNDRQEAFCARFYQNEGHKYIIIVHGINSSSFGVVRYLDLFLSRGYNVLLPDLRYCGMSDGKVITFGKEECKDILMWIDYLKEMDSEADIGIMGESLGAATALMTAARTDKLRFCIEYCGFASMDFVLRDIIKRAAPALAPLRFGMYLVLRMLFKINPKEVSAAADAKNIKCPVLVIHSKKDEICAFKNADLIVKNIANCRTKYFDNPLHARSYTDHPEEFAAAVHDFLDEVGA